MNTIDITKITELHAHLLAGISIEELSDKSLLKYGSLLLRQFRQAKAILRKIELDDFNKTKHWSYVKEFGSQEIDEVLIELESRMMTDPESFADGMLLSFVDLVGSIRVAMFDEDQLDAGEEESDTTEVTLILE